MSRLCGMRPEGLTVDSRFSPLPSMCFFDTIIIPLPAWIRLTVTFALFHFIVPVLIVDKIKRYTVKKEWQRHAQLSVYFFSILVVFLMEIMEIARLAEIRYAIGLLPFVFAGCGVCAVMQATRGIKGKIRNWQVANIIFWIMSVAVTIIKILTIQRSSMRFPEFRRMGTDYPTTHQVQDLAVIAGFYVLLLINEIALFFQKTWEETVDAENIKKLRLTRSISDQARYDLTRAIEEGYYPSGVTYLTLRLEGESQSEKAVSKDDILKKTASMDASIAGSSSSEKTAGKRLMDEDSIEPVPMIPPSFRRNSERWSSAMTLKDAAGDDMNEKVGGKDNNKKRGSERWSNAMTIKEPTALRDGHDKRVSSFASPMVADIDEITPLDPPSTSSSRYEDEHAAQKAMLLDSPFPMKELPDRRSFMLKPSRPNTERWSNAMTLRGEPSSGSGSQEPSPKEHKEYMPSAPPAAATAPTTPERRASASERNIMRRYSDASTRSIRRFSARSDLREAAATAAAFVDGDEPLTSPTEAHPLQPNHHTP
ncbi:hypothetical protein CABS01_09958 [Colletotrichum abscissum]|uniref:Uncharacterized protein n=2 Tax=Colletotrichum acutatum species complex TaxID=2707335 RepID=A0A9P9X2R1_9PEZI|nr:uncharacterized protein CCOS01_10712 [Colletotrichum costaricense]XP_060399495.1 uncharacterized protein CABS01_09958 [Colletotrichum abscissum]KAI3532885.1 hypothetical protein CABS02_13730 [Colletotrichum abscissum]KAK1500234.1 hypothetical protein CABS01_09958 [Colletotrichum abscissum]KAK1520593.1 hypothetical protein CCOS01_10712 [Colletotrichum costaricense]